MTNDEALCLFRETGALLEGHFVLRSGLHSRQFFQCALALQQMPIVERFGAALAERLRSLGAVTVIAPAMGGLVIGQEVARQLGLRFIFAEKENNALVLRRGFTFTPGAGSYSKRVMTGPGWTSETFPSTSKSARVRSSTRDSSALACEMKLSSLPSSSCAYSGLVSVCRTIARPE